MDKDFFIGAATAAHQVEGNNIYSDCWALEQMENSNYKEPSLDAVDHYHYFERDIKLLADSGLNAYRFSIEWARIEPEQGQFDQNEIDHYRSVLECCLKNGVTPIVTMHHFSSPRWLITQGGWECEDTISSFANYCAHVVKELGTLMEYVCTINEANMGLQIASIAKDMMAQSQQTAQIGLNFDLMKEYEKKAQDEASLFNLPPGEVINPFLSVRTELGDKMIMMAHEAARESMRELCPHLKIGLTLSLYDIQVISGGELLAQKEWDEQFGHYLPYIKKDDFIGVQNYTRKIIGENGTVAVPSDVETTQMGYEFYPESLGNVIRRVWQELALPILVTENGLATADDSRRIAFIQEVLAKVKDCVNDGIPVKGYLYWSLLDNFEWQEGFSKQFGLIAVDRSNQRRIPKESLSFLGNLGNKCFLEVEK